DDPGDPGGGQRITARQPAGGDHRHHVGPGPQHTPRDLAPLGGPLRGHVNHVRRAGAVQVRQAGGGGSGSCGPGHRYLLITVTGCMYGSSSCGNGNSSSPNGDNAPTSSAVSSVTACSSSGI